MQQIEMGIEVETGWRVTSADRTKMNKARSKWPPPQWIPVVTFALFSLAIGRVIVECSSLKVRLKVRGCSEKGSRNDLGGEKPSEIRRISAVWVRT